MVSFLVIGFLVMTKIFQIEHKENATENEKKKDAGKFYYSFEVNLDSEFNLNNKSEGLGVDDLPQLLEVLYFERLFYRNFL